MSIIISDNSSISEGDTSPKNPGIIKKKYSILGNYITELTKGSLMLDHACASITYDQSSIMVRMYCFLGNKSIRKGIWVGSDIEVRHIRVEFYFTAVYCNC